MFSFRWIKWCILSILNKDLSIVATSLELTLSVRNADVDQYDGAPLARFSSQALLVPSRHLQIDTISVWISTWVLEILVLSGPCVRTCICLFYVCGDWHLRYWQHNIHHFKEVKFKEDGEPSLQKGLATGRFLSYRSFYLHGLKWFSPSIGVMLLVFVVQYTSLVSFSKQLYGFARSYSSSFDTRTQTILLAEYEEAILWRLPATRNKIRMDGCGSPSIRNVRELAYKFLDFGRDLIFLYRVLSSKLSCITFLTGISMKNLWFSTAGRVGRCLCWL